MASGSVLEAKIQSISIVAEGRLRWRCYRISIGFLFTVRLSLTMVPIFSFFLHMFFFTSLSTVTGDALKSCSANSSIWVIWGWSPLILVSLGDESR